MATDIVAAKRKAQVVEMEWAVWLKTPDQFVPIELLDAWSDLLEELLGRPPKVDEDKPNTGDAGKEGE